MNSSHSQQRKELPKVCKQFPEEFLFQRQKTAQSTLNSLNRVDIEQFFDYDQVLKSNISTASSSATSNRLQNPLLCHKNIQFPQLSKDILNQIISVEGGLANQNPKGSSINNIFQQNKQNNAQQEDLFDRKQLKQSFLLSLNQNPQQKMLQNQDLAQKMLNNSSRNKILDGEKSDFMVPILRHRGSTNLIGQKLYEFNAEDEVMEDFKEKEDYQDSLDKIQISPELHLLNENIFQLQNQASIIKLNNIIEKKERNNSHLSMANKSQSSSTSKRIEFKNKKSTQITSSSFTLTDGQRNVENPSNCLHSRIASRKNQSAISQTEQAFDSQQTEDEDSIQLKLGFKKQSQLETLEKSRVLIEKAINQNSTQMIKQDNQIRASSSCASFISNQQSNRSAFKQIPYILTPSNLNQNKQYLIQGQNKKNLQINQQLFLSRNNSIENLPSQISQSIQLNQNHSDKQINDANLLNSPILRLPKLTLNADQKLLSINNSALNFINDNNFQEQQQQQTDQTTCKTINGIGVKREIKTPNFNTMQANRNQNTSSLQLDEQKKMLRQSKEKSETSFQNNQQMQMIRISSVNSDSKEKHQNEIDEMNSFELEVKSSYYQRKQQNENIQEKKNNKQDLDASFGTNQNNKNSTFQLNEDQTLTLLDTSMNQQNSAQIEHRKKNIAQKNFKCNKSQQVSKNQNHKHNQNILQDDIFSQKNIDFSNQTQKKAISNRNQERSLSNALDIQYKDQQINAFGQIQNQKLSLHSYGFSMRNKESVHQRSQILNQNKANNSLKDQHIISFDIDSYYQNLQQNIPNNFLINEQLKQKYPQKQSCIIQNQSNQNGFVQKQNDIFQAEKMKNDSNLSEEKAFDNLLHTFNASKNTDQLKLQEVIQNFQFNNQHYLNCVESLQLSKAIQPNNKNILKEFEKEKEIKQQNSSSQNQKQRIEKNQHYFIQVKNDKYLQKKNLVQSKHKSVDLKQIISKQKTNSNNKTKIEEKNSLATRSISNQQDNNLYINEKSIEIQDPK
ncbi:endo-1,4-beta-xylanase xylA, putative (macronuclear) [Tetrahymena thermophila SB210]|uniref:Endo-1,4-beta-xylanase xylA, putative n=1 Tax=Tetrahymena thermophila (strain SB210) TaxID=312017 RepID=Q22Z02_TETTS|nr:endo-1,4-beta-xylanase xylA, putative [Tetrahymena thermophila SB210]EAR90519.2 endo-1,4-beta-xylanase xylA, putative [Tetrahymena thermophila SB210]|eukprot:XP_001010764.2 endo-1,4-beta-xylanase xylA, putative [Tetrahymena thermophila SB210]